MSGQRAGGCRRPGLFSPVTAGDWRVFVVLALVVSSLTGCGGQRSSAAPPWVVCGTTLVDSPEGPAVTDATRPGLRVGSTTVATL